MGFPSFLLPFFLVSHLLVLHASVFSCPSPFDCGLCTLSCDEGALKIESGDEGRSIQVSDFTDDAIKISDPMLKGLIYSKSCDFFSYVHPINTGSISYTISRNQTFFKCLTESPEIEDQTDKHFSGYRDKYEGCQGYTVYYSYPNDTVPTPGPVPKNCTLFQLPVVSPVELKNQSDLFSLLTSDFSVEYQVSKECRECYKDGGHCPRDNQGFHCLKKTVPEVVLGEEGTSYQVIGIHDDTIHISDLKLKESIESKDCDIFSNIIPPNTPSISFTISTNLTFFFKCPTGTPAIDDPKDKRFFDDFSSYTGCPGYTVHYLYPINTVPAPGSYPLDCEFFQLPAVSPVEGRNLSDPFSLLTSDFSVEYHVPKERVVAGRSPLRLILGIVVPTTGIMVILLFCIIFKKHAQTESTFFWKTKTESYENIKAFLRTCGSLSPIQYTYSDIKKITKSFRTKLGQGGFGTVFKGELENGSLVAVKVLKGSKGNGDEFINEVATISRTSHVNIVTLRGFCFEGSHRALIYDFMRNGSLDKFIRDGDSSTSRKLGWQALYRIAVGIARRLEYLHRGCNARIVHFDIKPHNILLDEDFCPKISDFGLAKLCPQKESIISLLGARGTTGYIAPEVFCRNFGGVSHKSDVYSYGMMVLEMVGARKNPSVEVDRSSEIYFPHWVYKRLELDEKLGLRGVVDDEANGTVRKMIIVGLWCIQTDPSIRPSISQVVEMLEGSPESLLIPPKPFLSSPSRAPVDSFTTHVMTLRQCIHASTE